MTPGRADRCPGARSGPSPAPSAAGDLMHERSWITGVRSRTHLIHLAAYCGRRRRARSPSTSTYLGGGRFLGAAGSSAGRPRGPPDGPRLSVPSSRPSRGSPTSHLLFRPAHRVQTVAPAEAVPPPAPSGWSSPTRVWGRTAAWPRAAPRGDARVSASVAQRPRGRGGGWCQGTDRVAPGPYDKARGWALNERSRRVPPRGRHDGPLGRGRDAHPALGPVGAAGGPGVPRAPRAGGGDRRP